MENTSFKRYALTGGENTYSSPASSNAQDARRLQSLIPSLSGQLDRESPNVPLCPTILDSPVSFFHQFKHNDGFGNFTYFFFCATHTTLYIATGVAPSITWIPVAGIGGLNALSAVPSAANIDNLMHVSDGTHSWCFDGVNWFTDGLPVAINGPQLTITVGVAGTNLINVNRFYWTTYTDETVGRTAHESSSSLISVGTGAVRSDGQIVVQQEPGTITTDGSPNVVGVGTAFNNPRHVGMRLYTASGVLQGVVASVGDTTHLTLQAGSAMVVAAALFTLTPPRATGWNVYASASENDQVGLRLARVPVGTVSYVDTSGMVGTSTSAFVNIQRPMIDDPTNPSVVMEVFQNRLFRVRGDFKNFFTFTGYEEILAQQTGSPAESVPGADQYTVSPDIINAQSMPDQTTEIRKLIRHGDSLYIGTDIDVIPFYGTSLASFGMNTNVAFKVGMAGKRCAVSTPFGLAFLSYDKKLYLYPSQYNFGTDSTTALVELSRPKRLDFEQILDLDNFNLVFYNYGRRNWLVCCFRRRDLSYHTWVFDFETKGWFELQRGTTAIAVFEINPGNKLLIGAGSDNVVYVLDDLTGTYALVGNYPAGTYRQLVDFGDPDSDFVIMDIEYETSDAALQVNVTTWLDPADPENPGPGVPIVMGKKIIGANRFQGRIPGGSTCQRLLVEYSVPASTVNASLRGIAVKADKLVGGDPQ